MFVSIRKTDFATKFYLRCNYSSRYKYSRLTSIAVNNCSIQILGTSNLADSWFLLHSKNTINQHQSSSQGYDMALSPESQATEKTSRTFDGTVLVQKAFCLSSVL